MTGWGRYAWVAVWMLPGFFSSARPGDPRFVAALVVGVLVGVLWQVLARRDVGRRLTALAALGLLLGVLWALAPQTQQEPMSADLGPAIYFLGVVCSKHWPAEMRQHADGRAPRSACCLLST